ncbi:MAG: general secretion pathway protein GspK [Burkholderiales bacterium]|nr:general secretion pathway protein GspK [Burkholderiales bacterium]
MLPATVILLALISVGVALMSHRSDQLRELVVASKQEADAEAAVQDTLARMMYISSLLPRTGGQMGTIQLDGRYYDTSSGVYVSVLDGGALIDLRHASGLEISGLLRALGVPEASIDTLTDTLLDYQDADSLVRLNGAEAPDYAAAGMPPPRNGALLMPTELQRIMAWKDLDPATLRKILDNVYVSTDNALNRNTVKAPVLAAAGGADLAAAQALIALRDSGRPLAIESLPNIARGSFFGASRYLAQPSATLLLTLCPTSVAWCQRVSLTTSADGEAPWHVDYSLRRPRTDPLPPRSQVTELPDQSPVQQAPVIMTPFGILQ